MTTTQTLLPCLCGGRAGIGKSVVFCGECSSETPLCPDFPTAVRAWNAMQQAALDAKEKSNPDMSEEAMCARLYGLDCDYVSRVNCGVRGTPRCCQYSKDQAAMADSGPEPAP